MKHPIDPKIDCVFKALLGTERNRRLLVHFLNAILAGELAAPIIEVEILNPYNEREFLDDKLSIVDVKARDQAGRLYQIEIQLLNAPDLPARILYGWADLYSAQLRDGDGYDQLKPTYSIWLLGQTLRPWIADAVHRFRLRDDQGRSLVDHGGIWLLELSKCRIEVVETEQDRWLKFFIEGERLDDEHLPAWMQTEEMRQAMSTLKAFSEKELGSMRGPTSLLAGRACGDFKSSGLLQPLAGHFPWSCGTTTWAVAVLALPARSFAW